MKNATLKSMINWLVKKHYFKVNRLQSGPKKCYFTFKYIKFAPKNEFNFNYKVILAKNITLNLSIYLPGQKKHVNFISVLYGFDQNIKFRYILIRPSLKKYFKFNWIPLRPNLNYSYSNCSLWRRPFTTIPWNFMIFYNSIFMKVLSRDSKCLISNHFFFKSVNHYP